MSATIHPFDAMMTDDRWLGFGYLGERRNALEDEYLPASPAFVAEVDALVLAHVQGWTYDEVFAWANSKAGRWFGDVVFGSAGSPADRFDRAVRYGYLRKQAVDA